MDKSELGDALLSSHDELVNFVDGLSGEDFEFQYQEKWSAGQQVDHIKRSVSPVALAFRVPKFVLKAKFGLTNRPSRSYEGLVEKYQGALVNAYSPPKEFLPKEIPFSSKDGLVKGLQEELKKLIRRMHRCSEKDLDLYILPHPLIGKLTLREMCYFTIYHAQHHQALIEKYLGHK